MTVERIEGTEPAGEADSMPAESVDGTVTQPQADVDASAEPVVQPTEVAEKETAEAAQPPASAPQAPDVTQPEAAPDTESPDTEAVAPLDSADPSPEAAVGASGARPLGDAEEVADRVASAVDAMTEARDGTGPEAETSTVEAVATPAADDSPAEAAADSEAVTAEGSSSSDEAAATAETVSQDEAAAAPPAEAEPPRREGPEPTTMEELLNEQPGEIRSLKHGDVVEGKVVRIDKDEILVDIGAKSEGVVSNRELYGRNAETQPQLNIDDTVLVYVLQPESQEGHAVLSLRRAGLERKWRSMQEQFETGVIIEAPVIDHNKGGLIVDCGIRGFVPISQIVDFPRRPQNEQPRDAAQEIAEKLQPYVGRKLRLKILEVNRKANRLILSEKVALYEERREKRDELFSSLQVGQKVTGTVRSIAPFGVFIDLGGIDGLVHKSELSWNKVNNPEAGYKVGEEVEAEVIDINHERGRISLSIRRLQPDPWHSTVADLKVNDLIEGAVTKIVNFGAFVRVRDGLEGLIHISELSNQRVAHPGDVVHEGQSLNLRIISLDSERHRLGLSLKQAEEAPARPPERERRPRQERSFDASQAVQEPEGGIDNTLAAAFAQVRQQIEETEAARTDEPDQTATAEVQTDAESEPIESVASEVLAEEAHPVETPHAQIADAPAPEVGASDTGATPEAAADAGTADVPTVEVRPADEAAAEAPAVEEAVSPAADEVTAAAESSSADAAVPTEVDSPAAEAADAETPAADTEAPAADAETPATDVETPATDDTEPEPAAETAAVVTESTGEPVADTSGDPAEGAPDAAPEAGADREDQPAS